MPNGHGSEPTDHELPDADLGDEQGGDEDTWWSGGRKQWGSDPVTRKDHLMRKEQQVVTVTPPAATGNVDPRLAKASQLHDYHRAGRNMVVKSEQ